MVLKLRSPTSEEASKLGDRKMIGLVGARQHPEVVDQLASQVCTGCPSCRHAYDIAICALPPPPGTCLHAKRGQLTRAVDFAGGYRLRPFHADAHPEPRPGL